MADQSKPAVARIKLSVSQIYCLAWAARPGQSRPPLEHFGVHRGGWGGGYLNVPLCSSGTWRSLLQRKLVELPHDDYSYHATELGKAWLRYHELLDKALS